MERKSDIFGLLKAYFFGASAYLFGGLISIPFEQIRTSTILSPRVPLIAVGIGGLIFAFTAGYSKTRDIVKLVVKTITAYLAVILVGIIIILPMKTGQESEIIINMVTILIPTIAYGTLFGILSYGFSHTLRFASISFLTAVPITIIAVIYHYQQNVPIEFDSLWLYAVLGTSISVIHSLYHSK
jgi:hypothetical protein